MDRTPDDQLQDLIGEGLGDDHLTFLPREALVATIRQLAGELLGVYRVADRPAGFRCPA